MPLLPTLPTAKRLPPERLWAPSSVLTVLLLPPRVRARSCSVLFFARRSEFCLFLRRSAGRCFAL